jgi:hypothetical protein
MKNKEIDFFGGSHLSRFDLNNMISTYTKKKNSWKKWPKFAKFPRKNKKSKLPYFNDKFQ